QRCLPRTSPVAYLCLVRRKRSARVNSSEAESWPAQLDALVAAPEHHTLLFENDSVRILDTRVAAGDRTPVHASVCPALRRCGTARFRAQSLSAPGFARSVH